MYKQRTPTANIFLKVLAIDSLTFLSKHISGAAILITKLVITFK